MTASQATTASTSAVRDHLESPPVTDHKPNAMNPR